MSSKKNKNIDWSIISRNLFGKANHSEKSQYEEWLNASPEHGEYVRQSKLFYEEAESEKQRKPDTDQAISAFRAHVNKQKKEKRVQMKVLLRYAAVLLLPLCIATFLLLKTNEAEEELLAGKVEIIEAGTAKAQLLLADGKTVDLEKKEIQLKESDGTAISNREGLLKYQANEKILQKETYNTLKIPRGGEYQLQLSDGTKVWLNSGSSFKYPTNFVGKKRVVYLTGEAFFDVAHNKEKAFVVKVNDLNVKVLGTSFNLKAYPDEERIQTTLVQGKVEVQAKGAEGRQLKTVLTPNFQANYSKGAQQMKVDPVNTEIFTAWKDGVFILDHMNLEELTVILSRWYNVNFFFRNEKVKENRFTGRMKKYDNLQDIFDLLEELSDVKFEVKDKAVIVSEKV